MLQPNFKAVIEDSYRNKYFLYYSGTSVCCKEVSKDGVTRDTIIASHVNENFLATIDLQDRVYVACYNKEKGVYLFQYSNGDWRLEHILNIQGSGNMRLLSLFSINGALHIIYAKQMTIANFYNIIHLYKPESSDSYRSNTTWRKNNICEMYAENLDTSYSSIMSKEGGIHLVCEWFDGTKYVINYCWFDSLDDGWKKKSVATLFKKDISLEILYEDSFLHLLCYTYEDDTSAIFYYTKKEGSGKDFEFSCLDKISTEAKVSPLFHTEGSVIYASWIYDDKFYQYALSRDQKNWAKKISGAVAINDPVQPVEFIRNRKGKYWIVKKTYFTIDYKFNINLPYFKDSSSDETSSKANADRASIRTVDGDLVSYIPYLIDEVKVLSQMVKDINEKLVQMESRTPAAPDNKPPDVINKTIVEKQPEVVEHVRLKKSNFKDQFMKSNKLLSRPEATAVFVGAANIPDPEELSKKEGIEIIENNNVETQISEEPSIYKVSSRILKETPDTITAQDNTLKNEQDNSLKDSNLFKKLGDFFK